MKRAGRIWRWLLLALLVMTGIICLGGCGQDRSMTEDGRVRLSYAIWDKNQQPAMQAIVDEFEAENPDIKVDIQIIPWNQYWTKLEAGAMSKTMPDVFWMHPQSFVRYASNDILLDLTGQLGDDYDAANYPQGLSDFYTYDGHQYAVPKDYDTVALWYNKKLFDAKGIPYPDETWDWAKLVEVAQQLTDADNGIYGFLAPPDQQAVQDLRHVGGPLKGGGRVVALDVSQHGGSWCSLYLWTIPPSRLRRATSLCTREARQPLRLAALGTSPYTGEARKRVQRLPCVRGAVAEGD